MDTTKSLSPMDRLDVGATVQVGSKRGLVAKAELVRDQHGNPIMLHTIRFTQRAKRLFGSRVVWEAITPQVQAVNYASIRPL